MKAVRLIVTQTSGLRVDESPMPRGANTQRGASRHWRVGTMQCRPFHFNSVCNTSTSFVRADAGNWMVTVWSA